MEFISSALSSLHVLSMFASHDKDLNGFLHVHQWMSSISVISLQYPFASTLRRSLNPELRRFISNRCKTSTYKSFLCNYFVTMQLYRLLSLQCFICGEVFHGKYTGPMNYFVDTLNNYFNKEWSYYNLGLDIKNIF